MKKIINKESGFTLIEVVLVLAIGALIILMALLAFNGAQRSRKDTARTNLAGTIAASVEQYAANNGGVPPTTAVFGATGGGSTTLVVKSNWQDPDSKGVVGSGGTAFGATAIGIKYYPGQVCNANKDNVTPGASTNYALLIRQNSGQIACRDNQ